MISACFLPNKKRQVDTTLYGFKEDVTLLWYTPKKKAVLLMSSMHNSASRDLVSRKPETIADYGMTKGGG